jgi:hypothetical protein
MLPQETQLETGEMGYGNDLLSLSKRSKKEKPYYYTSKRLAMKFIWNTCRRRGKGTVIIQSSQLNMTRRKVMVYHG